MIAWDKHVHMLLYGVSMRLDPLPHVEGTLKQFLGDRVEPSTIDLLLEHIEMALASEDDLSVRLDQVAPDAVVRAFLAAARQHLLELRGGGVTA